jgi:hypothetical protein
LGLEPHIEHSISCTAKKTSEEINLTDLVFRVNHHTFVKNQVRHTLQVGIALFQLLSSNNKEGKNVNEISNTIYLERTVDTYVINKSAGGTNDNFDAGFQNSDLFELGYTAIDHCVLDITRRAKLVAFFFDLNSKFTRGSEDKHNRAVTRAEVWLQNE